jgi:hypothetical protein
MTVVNTFAIDPSLVATSPQEPDIVVTTAAELQSALSPANAGARILVRAGVYDVSQALTVPDRAVLVGEGVMSFDESGLPTGFEPSGRTLLKAAAGLVGNFLTLGDGATVRGLAIENIAGQGHAVAVVSRAPGDVVSARIEECEIINPNLAGGGNRGLAVMTLKPDLEPAHEGAVLRVKMTRSIVRSPRAANGVFAINLASHSEILLDFESNVVGGGINAAGGAGGPTNAVTGAGVIINSSHNFYRSDSLVPTATGLSLSGGADSPPAVTLLGSQAATFNSLQMHSIDDTIAGFATGIVASGGRRINALSEPISSNRVELNFHGTLLQTTTTDLRLAGASSLPAALGVSTGDDNTAHVLLNQATGSGARLNQYAHSATPPMGNPGIGNRLEIVGNANAFDQTNQNFVPPPPAEFFTGGH